MASLGANSSDPEKLAGSAEMESDALPESTLGLPSKATEASAASGAGLSSAAASTASAGAKASTSGDLEAPWVEKYRPQEVSHLVLKLLSTFHSM